MAHAAATIDAVAQLFAGLTDAAAALRQVGSLAQAVGERQGILNDLDTQIAQKHAVLDAVMADTQSHLDYHTRVITNANEKASAIADNAQTAANQAMREATAQAGLIRQDAIDHAAKVAADANEAATNLQASSAMLTSDIDALTAKKAALQADVDNLEQQLSIHRSSLRQLLGDNG